MIEIDTELDTTTPLTDAPQEASGTAIIIRDRGQLVLLADCPSCPDGGVYGHAVIQRGDPPGTLIRDPAARCDRCGAIFVFETSWTEEDVEVAL